MRCILISVARFDPCQVPRGHSGLVAVHSLLHLGSWYWAILDLMFDLPLSFMKIFVDFPLVLLDHELIIEVVRTKHQFFIELKTSLQLCLRVREVEFGEFVDNLTLSVIAIQGWQFDPLESRLGSCGRFRGRGKVHLPFGEVLPIMTFLMAIPFQWARALGARIVIYLEASTIRFDFAIILFTSTVPFFVILLRRHFPPIIWDLFSVRHLLATRLTSIFSKHIVF
jgi:hypothetical protein